MEEELKEEKGINKKKKHYKSKGKGMSDIEEEESVDESSKKSYKSSKRSKRG